MSLVPCANVIGEVRIFVGTPATRVIENAVYVPLRTGSWMDWDDEWGIYTSAGDLVEEAAYRRGPGPVLVGQSQKRGLALGHYGHFLLDTLSRHWFNPETHSDAPLLYHRTDHPLDEWRKRSFVTSCFDAAGFGSRKAVSFDVPTLIPRLIVPAPAFEETYGAHHAFRDLALRISHKLAPEIQRRSNRLVYFSKERLSHGIRRVLNERDITTLLSLQGVDIVFPEQMSLSEQIMCFNDYDLVIGTLGSALHTAVFSAKPPKVLAIHCEDNILSTFKIIDQLTGGKSLYLRPNSRTREMNEVEGFYSNILWDDPEVMVKFILAVAEIF